MVEVVEGIRAINLSEAGRLSLECYLLDCPQGVVLVDTGMQESAISEIEAELTAMGKHWKDVKTVLITHKHGDHVNNLPKVKELTGAPIMAHEGDCADIRDAKKVDVTPLSHGQAIGYCGGIEVVSVPGHSQGNVCYYLPEKRVMIAGDTIFADENGVISAPPERYCMDVKQATRGISRLLDYDFDVLLVTHGKNTLKDAKAKVLELVDRCKSV